jgi:hypothetical protein
MLRPERFAARRNVHVRDGWWMDDQLSSVSPPTTTGTRGRRLGQP